MKKEFSCPTGNTLDAKTIAEGLKYFKDILKIDSRNPDADEEKVIRYIDKILKKEGFKTKIFSQKKGRLNLIARLKAKNPGKPALMLSSHVDTVPWSESYWRHHPLSAKEEDGYIYGRGAIDMKHHTIYSLMTLLQLKRSKVELDRDIVFVALADEEAGCSYGSQLLVEKHQALIDDVEFALNEVGGFPVYVEDRQFFFIQTEEKGFAWYKIDFQGKAGHGSLASKASANNPLTAFIQNVFQMKPKANPSNVTKNLIQTMSSEMPLLKRFVFRLLKNRSLNNMVLQILPADKQESFYAMTHDTYAPTVIESSDKTNVVPGDASVYLDTRFLPTSSVNEVTNVLQKMLPAKAKMSLIKTAGPVQDIGRSDIYDIIEKQISNDVNDATVVPYTLIGFSDACQFTKIGIKTLGFSPVYFPPEVIFSDLFHGHNERIYRPGFEWGMDIFYRVVREYCSIG